MIDIQIGDSRKLIHGLADKSIDCVMTSPPYWGLRDYGHPDQIGLEKTPEEYLTKMLDFFDDVKMKLKDGGNCFVNLGDSYWGGKGKSGYELPHEAEIRRAKGETMQHNYNVPGYLDMRPSDGKHPFIQPKSLCMIPPRFAWGMIERGWILRNEIIWHKPNHMPESVTDRWTKAHEVIYFFTKQQKNYFNLDAIREPHKIQSLERYSRSVRLGSNAVKGKYLQRDLQNTGVPRKAPKWFREGAGAEYKGKFDTTIDPESFGSPRARTQRHKHSDNQCRTTSCLHDGRNPLDVHHPNGKNPGTVWDITTQPYSEAHFATFPLTLIRQPILAGCPVGGTVLDPFGGSGTVGEFCRKNNRNAILFELNPEYKPLIEERTMNNIPDLMEYENCV